MDKKAVILERVSNHFQQSGIQESAVTEFCQERAGSRENISGSWKRG